jgi:hypothetical protein
MSQVAVMCFSVAFRSKLQASCERLLDGVRKLNETEALVASMKADLAALQPVLEAKAVATAELLEKVSDVRQPCCWCTAADRHGRRHFSTVGLARSKQDRILHNTV